MASQHAAGPALGTSYEDTQVKLALIMESGHGEDRTFPLRDGRTVIGRDGRCDLRLPIPSVQPRHCEIMIENARAILLASSPQADTLVNGAAVTRIELAHEDEVRIGPVVFRIAVSSAPGGDATRMTIERNT